MTNAAGYTGKPNVDACELAKADCLDGNAVLPGTIRQVCEELKIRWGHVSSGCIYLAENRMEEGGQRVTYRIFHSDLLHVSHSGSKALGEEVLGGAENCYIWRLRIPFNEERNPRNYLQKLLNYDSLLEAENSVSHLDEFLKSVLNVLKKKLNQAFIT